MLESDRAHSCYVSVQALEESGWSPQQISEELSKKFDLVVFSTANAIRPNLDPGCTAHVLDNLSIDFIVLGMGMQNPLPPDKELLHPNLIQLLDVCSRKAKIFGVRGMDTENWLKSVGFDRAKALGCPSLYVYPQNILNITSPDPSQVKSAITGGYINGRVPRSSAIISLFKGFDAHYVMQEEIASWRQQGLIGDATGIYNDATGELDRNYINQILEDIHDEKMPFSSYRWFQDPNAWRMFASRFDIYLGDRLHGGIASMQAGVPSILMTEDRRVTEIADFFGIPKISVREAESSSLQDVIADKLSPNSVDAFKQTYSERFRETEAVFRDSGISLTVGPGKGHVAANRSSGPAYIPPTKRSPVKMIRRLLRKL
ncbi:MAG: polysaccharide pyruvyl transferase family protein [Thiobacillus sp.]